MPVADPELIRIVRQSPHWVVIDKPSGVLSVPGKGPQNQACAASWVQARFPNASGPLTVHRLDMDTSGLLLLALDPESHRRLSRQFEAREVEKAYTALVEGRVSADRGVIDVPIRADIENRPRQIVDRIHGRPAVTRWSVTVRAADRTRLELIPETGRTHQLRVHCALPGPQGLAGTDAAPSQGGHPILGDALYGDPATAPRLLLHASRLAFSDPVDAARIELLSPPPF